MRPDPRQIARRAALIPQDQRADALRAECGGDDALRREVERLLALDEGATLAPDSASSARAAPPRSSSSSATYRILSALGQRGMGVGYLADQVPDGHRVALMFLRPGVVGCASLVLLEREARTLGRLQHPGIARVLDAGAMPLAPGAPPQPFIAMEYVEGVPIA